MPTLPGLSLLLDDENNMPKVEATPKIEPRKTFQQWKQQHEAIFIDNNSQQRKPDKKQVRFETDNQINGKQSHQRHPSSVSPNLELSYYEVPDSHGDNNYHNKQSHLKQCHQPCSHYNSKLTEQSESFEKNTLQSRCNSKTPTTSPIVNDKAYNAWYDAANEHQTVMKFPQFNRIVRSESVKDNCHSGVVLPVHNEQQQYHMDCCQQGCQNRRQMICNHAMQPNGCIRAQRECPSQQQELMKQKESLTDETLFSIMEEQQQHILLQQSQILMQQKQNMMQQNQVSDTFALYLVEYLLQSLFR